MATGACALCFVVWVRRKLGDSGAEAHDSRWAPTREAARLGSGINTVDTSRSWRRRWWRVELWHWQRPVAARARALCGVVGVRENLRDSPAEDHHPRRAPTRVAARNPANWLFNNAYAGGGILSWLGCHYIDMIRYVTGDEIVAVSAEVATRSGEAIDVEDVAILSLRFRSGAVGSLHAGYMMALSGGGYHNKAGYDTYGGFNGQLGRITWSSPSSPTKISAESIHPAWASAPQRTFDLPLAESPAYGGVSGENFMRGFIQAAQGQGEAWTSGSDALQVARIVDAAYESSRTGRRIEIAAP